ncbi:gamma-aminobutyric acid type B receptor subunit 2-like isoform X2 [Artemia franciscana]|uniref:gamma-aminobutyric acid type B receptor subunit 2-like isoform X2 n=1 Tax=Artemia franciscana TaxID=6661 RepID=UPI0032D9F597
MNKCRNYAWIKCSAAVGMKSFFDMMDRSPKKVSFLGGSCTSVTDPIAKTSKRFKMTLISYADTHPMFTKKNYPNFFRLVPSENALNEPRIQLLKYFNWTRVGILYQTDPKFSLAHNHLLSELEHSDIEVPESQSFVDDLVTPLGKLREKDVRIILGNFNSSWARKVFCHAYAMGIYGKRYQWIIAGPQQEQWWLEDSHSECSLKELLTALEGVIVVEVQSLTDKGLRTISGLTSSEYAAQYNALRGGEYTKFHGYAYDALWTIALAIDTVSYRMRQRHSRVYRNQSLADFSYRSSFWEKLFLDALRTTSFNGVTGSVKFTDNEREGYIVIKQFQDDREEKVGLFDGLSNELAVYERTIYWSGGRPPKDRTLQIIVKSRVNRTIFSILSTISSLGILLALIFLAINIRYRNQRNIKMSSPYLNNVIIVGCFLTYTSVILLGLDSGLTSEAALPVICTARVWTLMAGFTLAFGSMFSKTWRVHSVFTDIKMNKKAIKDYKLFMVVGILLAVDMAIMITWQVIDPFYRETKTLDPYPDTSNEDIEITPENEYCKSHHMTIFVGCIYGYKGLLMVYGCFLAWETRNVNIPALNDSKYIGMSVYNVVIMCLLGAGISYVLSDQQDVSFIIISVFIIFCTTGTLCLVFVPKVIELRRNPQGKVVKRIKRGQSTKQKRDPKNGGNEIIIKAKDSNSDLKKQLREKEEQIKALAKELGEELMETSFIETSEVTSSVARRKQCRKGSISVCESTSLYSVTSVTEGGTVMETNEGKRGNDSDESSSEDGIDEKRPSSISHPMAMLMGGLMRNSVVETMLLTSGNVTVVHKEFSEKEVPPINGSCILDKCKTLNCTLSALISSSAPIPLADTKDCNCEVNFRRCVSLGSERSLNSYNWDSRSVQNYSIIGEINSLSISDKDSLSAHELSANNISLNYDVSNIVLPSYTERALDNCTALLSSNEEKPDNSSQRLSLPLDFRQNSISSRDSYATCVSNSLPIECESPSAYFSMDVSHCERILDDCESTRIGGIEWRRSSMIEDLYGGLEWRRQSKTSEERQVNTRQSLIGNQDSSQSTLCPQIQPSSFETKSHKRREDRYSGSFSVPDISNGRRNPEDMQTILPIFHQLLEEKKRQNTEDQFSMSSCPNISIKCDIVEYL